MEDNCRGFRTTSLQFVDSRVRYDFKAEEIPDYLTANYMEKAINTIIQKNIPIKFSEVTRNEAESKGVDLTTVPPQAQKIRLVEIEDVNTQACIGEHVNNTSEISELGEVKILDFKKKGFSAYQIILTITKD